MSAKFDAETERAGRAAGAGHIRVYHVTDRENLSSIREQGLCAGWGDDGYGVYVFTCLASAEDYASARGWDGCLQDPVILEIDALEDELQSIDVHPEWPDPEKYLSILMRPADPDAPEEATAWRPLAMGVLQLEDGLAPKP